MPSKLASVRKNKRLTQDQLSELSGVTTRTIQRIESGNVIPHMQTLKILATAMDVAVEELSNDDPIDILPKQPTINNLLPLFSISSMIGLFMPILNVLLPLILWVWKRAESEAYDLEGRKVINFQLSMSLILAVSIALMVLFFPVGFVMFVIAYGLNIIVSLINLSRTIKSKPTKYLPSVNFLKY